MLFKINAHTIFISSSVMVSGGAMRKQSGANKNQSVIKPFLMQR
jgi:hypothetical protein